MRVINNYRMDSNEGGEGSSITSKRRHSCLLAKQASLQEDDDDDDDDDDERDRRTTSCFLTLPPCLPVDLTSKHTLTSDVIIPEPDSAPELDFGLFWKFYNSNSNSNSIQAGPGSTCGSNSYVG